MKKSNFVYLTFLSTDFYLYYVIGLFESWIQSNSKYPFYCAVTKNLPAKCLNILEKLLGNDHVIILEAPELELAYSKCKYPTPFKSWQDAILKLKIFSLTQFDKCLFLDADTQIIHNIDQLFELPEFSAVKDPYTVGNFDDWTQYVPGISSLNGGMFVFKPDLNFYNKIVAGIPNLPPIAQELGPELVSWGWHDQNILAYFIPEWLSQKELQLPDNYNFQILKSNFECDRDKKFIYLKHYSLNKRALPHKQKLQLDFGIYESVKEWAEFINATLVKYKLDLDLLNTGLLYPKIDLVVPYVDMNDRAWYKKFSTANRVNQETQEAVNAPNRFKGQGNFFRFFFRGIEKNMPWINNIFLLVQNRSEVPNWLNLTKIKVITHDDFIPEEFLPTYSSGTIECFLHRIPGLTEQFIYANDDFFILQPVNPEDFFEKNCCKFNLIKEHSLEKNSSVYFKACQYNYEKLLGKQPDGSFLRLDHEFKPYLKSKFTECFNIYENLIKSTTTTFRNPEMIFCYFFSLYLDKLNLRQDSNLRNGYKGFTYNTRFTDVTFNNLHCICLNDKELSGANPYENESLNNYFYKKFSKKSSYETTDFNFKTIFENKPGVFLYF